MKLQPPTRLAAFGYLLIAVLFSLPSVFAGGHKRISPQPEIDVDPIVAADIKAVIHDTAARWNSQDFATLLELWDPEEPFPTYLAEEQAQWFIGWDRLREYLDPQRPNPAIEVIREEMSNIHVKQIGADLAIAVWDLHFEMKVIGANPIGEDVRASAVLRNTDAGWRYIHWAESPKTTMVYIEDLFERDVAAGWDDYYEAAKQRKKEVWRRKREEQRNAAP